MKKYYLEHEDTYRGIKYNVKMMRQGHRCGYVIVPNKIKISDIDFSYDSGFDVHGGITFAKIENGLKVIGFDAAHVMDKPDLEIAKTRFNYTKNELLVYEIYESNFGENEFYTIRSTDYIIEHCKSLIDQLLKKYNNDKDFISGWVV